MSYLVIFPVSKETEANAYMNACNAHYRANFEPTGNASYIETDAYGQFVTPLYAEPYRPGDPEIPFEEPAECVTARADGAIAPGAVWPDVEEVPSE